MKNTNESFWKHIIKTDTCWLWSGAPDVSGYGEFKINGKTWKAHRFSYFVTYGDVENGVSVLHKCDNPICVRPDHLELGTQSKNIRDCVSRGRHYMASKTHCKNGHPLTKENISNSYSCEKRRWRRCNLCRRKEANV